MPQVQPPGPITFFTTSKKHMMRTIEISAYTVDELSQDAFARAYERFCSNFEYAWYTEVGQCRDGMLGLFPGARLDRDNDVTTGGIDDDLLQMSGCKLAAWINANIVDHLKKGQYRSMKTYSETPHKRVTRKESKATGNKWREYRSGLTFTVECPFSGMSVDCAALEPFMDFVTGKGYARWGIDWKTTTLEDLILEAFQAISKYVDDDIEYLTSAESFKEDCEANEREFNAHGRSI